MDKEKNTGEKNKKSQAQVIMLCLIMAVAVFLTLLRIEKNMLEDYAKETVIVLKQDIPARTLITEKNADKYFEIKEIEADAVPATGYKSIEELYGYMPVTALDKGIMPTRVLMQNENQITKDMQEPVIAGFTAEDIYQVVGGTLRAGDTIHIYSVDKETQETVLIWENVPIVQVFDSSGIQITNADTNTAAQRINIYMEKENVESLYTALAAGSLRVVKNVK